MFLDENRELIETSTLNIPERLKQIDPGYFLVRNHATSQWEVHHIGQVGNTLALNIPFQELDERTIQKVRETQIQYIDNIVAEMDRKNAKLETEYNKKIKECTQTVTKEIYRYLKSHESKETIDKDSKYCKKVV
jgi:hypothetical protein